MDTVKVDIQKLQLLNERIAQTIDALAQLRMSMYGIQHTSPQAPQFNPGTPYGVYGQGWPQSSFMTPFPYVPTSYPTTPFAAAPFPFVPGLQHTSTALPTTLPTTQPWPITSWTMPYTTGISHTSFDPTWQRTTSMLPWTQQPWTQQSWW